VTVFQQLLTLGVLNYYKYNGHIVFLLNRQTLGGRWTRDRIGGTGQFNTGEGSTVQL